MIVRLLRSDTSSSEITEPFSITQLAQAAKNGKYLL